MGTAERKAREKEQRRNDIINAAEIIFFSKGLASATMDEVAEKTELSKGTLYLYFKNKEELYFAINLRGIKILKSLCEKAYGRKKEGIDKVIAIGKAYIFFYNEHRDYFNTMMLCKNYENEVNLQNPYYTEAQAVGESVLGILTQAIITGIEDKSIRPELNPFMTAMALWGQVSGLMQVISFKEKKLKEKFSLSTEDLINYTFGLMRDLLKK